ncbi:SDR family NAD(P)-dependent oxidoreductase [Trinickia sp. LjRoot230]|uniref:SDR family NAD(P)-dependent oxidoreductase n=1 Tax=Trinickia sp. LjRoot230 TaxID=3342288 RepID=UPI003ECF059A
MAELEETGPMTIEDRDIAIIGMAGKVPGADNVSEFWANLCAGRDGLRALSDDELRRVGVRDDVLADARYVKVAAPLNGVDRFDPAFFRISPQEAELMDPQIRLLLQCAWETLEDAGYAGKGPQRIGVFAGAGGVTTSYFANFVNLHERFEKTTAGAVQLGNDKDFLATCISYRLNLTGPSMTVQTACSTSLVAVHQARMSVLNGECEMALAGGVSVRVPHEHGYHYREGYIFSRSGRVRPFDAQADGIVFGSGLGLVLLKRLADAVRDGDAIHAVIKGSALGNDGKGKMSYAASSAKGQVACIRAALDNAGVDAGSIGFVEAHGTGTAMGDPEEVKALSAAFRADTDRTGYCVLGAVKANVGHLEAAAGIVGLIKAVLVLKHGVIPPALHYATPNPRIRFEATPFRIDAAPTSWQTGKALRRAGVNSLGVGGTNAFVVLEQYARGRARRSRAQPSGQGQPGQPVAVPLSARTQASLHAYAARLAAFLERDERNERGGGTELELADIAYTLQTGRDAMACRAVFVVASIDALHAALRAYVERGEIAIGDGEAGALASAWMAGDAIDWLARYRGTRPRRVNLPTYVFASERCWIDAAPLPVPRTLLHPLLHANTSDLHELRYSSLFCGSECFLKDHQLCTPDDGQDTDAVRSILPGAAYLEMARAAFERAGHPHGDECVVVLGDVVWVRPIEVEAPTQVDIALLAEHDGVAFEVFGADQTVHCQGHARWREAPRATASSGPPPRGPGWDAARVYEAFASMGLRYGAAHRAIRTLWVDGGEARAQLVLPASAQDGAQDFALHPSLLDGALQAATALLVNLADPPCEPVVPFALDAVYVLHALSACPAEFDVHARLATPQRAHADFAKVDIDLYDRDGKLCVQLRGFTARALNGAPRAALLASEMWEPAAARALGARHEMARTQVRHVVLCGLPAVEPVKFGELSRLGGTVSSVSFESGDVARRYTQFALECFGIVQSLLRSTPVTQVLIQFVVPDAQDNRLFAGLSGLLKTAALENPQLAAQLIFIEADVGEATLAVWLDEDAREPQQTLIDRTGRTRRIAQWVVRDATFDATRRGGARDARADGAMAAACGFGPCSGSPYRAGGVYLITGGLGGLGALFARDIARRATGARVVMTGRASADDAAAAGRLDALCDDLRTLGAVAEYQQLQLDDAHQVQRVVTSVVQAHGRLDGIFHCAGMTADAFLLKQSAEAFLAVLAPKVAGTLYLHEAVRDIDLDFFVLFSSLTAALGNPGQGDYAAANGFMDRFASYRNALVAMGQCRGRTLSIRWPLWRDGGMQPSAADQTQLARSIGIRPMRRATGLRMFDHSLADGADQTLVMEGDPLAMRRALGVAEHGQSHQILAAQATSAASAASAASAKGVATSAHAAYAEDYLCGQLAARLKLPAERIDPRAPLENYGIDSIVALDLTRMLEQAFGPLPKTLFFEYLNLRDLAGYFVEAHAATLASLVASTASASASAPASSSAPSSPVGPAAAEPVASLRMHRVHRVRAVPARSDACEPIAIIGLAGRYPGARSVDAFWDVLRDGRDCIEEVPKSRWDWREYYSEDRTQPGRHYSRWGGFIDGVDEFDARFFNISPREAQTLDPQERLFLEQAWLAIEDAGYTRERLRLPDGTALGGPVGVYAGVMYNEYQLFGAQASLHGRPTGFASNPASIANRVSYFLDLHGPSMVVDTMCSSSLSAIHLACQDLRLKRTALALAGGVNVTIHPNKYLMLSAGQFISGDGRCQSFGVGGDGYIPGEGVGVVVLKRLADAMRDGDRIYATIRGSGLSHGGKTNGYTVPNPHAQASAIRDALEDARVEPRHISYVEAHGTGTKLGDPIEIAALSSVFRAHTADAGFCAIGSAKSNIGHCEAAAGIAGLTKVLLQMRHRAIAPSLHSAVLNPHIDFAATPFVVNQTLRAWETPIVDARALPRIAGISSFGAGGSNAHLIVEEYVAPERAAVSDALSIVPLSARTPEQLQQKACDLLAMLNATPTEPRATLASIAYTLQVGREAMPERVGVLADSLECLCKRLQAFVDGNTHTAFVYRGRVSERIPDERAAAAPEMAPGMDADALARVLEQWVAGVELNWRRLHRSAPPLVSLPAYPFARQRHWVDVDIDIDPLPLPRLDTAHADLPGPHPLLQRNTSDFDEQRFTSRFDGAEFFLTGTPGARSLSAAATLEMARAAFDASLPGRRTAGVLALTDIEWAQPGVVADGHSLAIALFDRQRDAARFEIYRADDDDDDEAVHCQGRVAHLDLPAPPRLDLAALHAQAGERLAELRLPAGLADHHADYVLHPALVADALQVAAELAGALAQPVALDAIHIVLPVLPGAQPAFAWVRPASAASGRRSPEYAAFDIDLCERDGNPYAQLRGLRFPTQALTVVAAGRTQAEPQAPRRVPIVEPARARSALVAAHARPAAIALSTPSSYSTYAEALGQRQDRPLVTLTCADAASQQDSDGMHQATALQPCEDDAQVMLFDHGDGIYAIRIDTPELAPRTIEALLGALRAAEAAPDLKVLVLTGGEVFLRGACAAHAGALAQGLYRAIAAFPYPTIASLRGDARGPGLLVAALCDLMVCSETACYGFTIPAEQLFPAGLRALFDARFGRACATALLYLRPLATGAQLRQMGWRGLLQGAGGVDDCAFALAADLASKPRHALQLLKRELARTMLDALEALDDAACEPGAVTAPASMRGAELALDAMAFAQMQVRRDESGVLVVTLHAGVNVSAFDAQTLVAELEALRANLAAQSAESAPRCVVLASEHPGFFPLDPACDRAAAAIALHDVLRRFEAPLVAVLDNDARGLAWFAALGASVCVYAAQGGYSADELLVDAQLADGAAMAFARHFDAGAAKRLMAGGEHSGAALMQSFGAPLVVDRAQAHAEGMRLAVALAAWPRGALAALRHVEPEANTNADAYAYADQAVPVSTDPRAGAQPPAALGPLKLDSDVVTAFVHPDGVLEIGMADRDAKNMFSDALSYGLAQAFEHVAASRGYKVVVLTGYDMYFSSGATRETLTAIHAGRARFIDNPLFRLPLDCTIPVIAGMQGHAMGAGWALGMFADIALVGDASRFRSPYLDYGFTPGAGATLIFPHVVGLDLARESLLSAREYSGVDLAARGLRHAVLARDDVRAAALALAGTLARADRAVLVALKRRWAFDLRRQLETALERELAMHAQTFVGQRDTLARIEHSFGAVPAPAPHPGLVGAAPANARSLAAHLRKLLAQELRMNEADIADDTPFVELGLDSVIGVTWVRKINETCGTSIEAVKVYSYPTLSTLAGFVADQVRAQTADAAAPTQRVANQNNERNERNERNAQNDSHAVPAPQAPTVLSSRRRRGADSTAAKDGPAARAARANLFTTEAIAVVGMAGRFAHANTLDAFWRNLAAGRDCIDEVPRGRWDVARYYQPGDPAPGKTCSKWLGVLEGHDRFDAAFFRIPPREARAMDPQQRVFLEVCWHAIEHAGYDPMSLAGRQCGVFVGCAASDYHRLSPHEQLSGPGFTGAAPSILAARIAYLLDLAGPSVAIDTACSSSLVAIASACDSLATGASDLALAGGVNVLSGPAMHIMTSQMGMLSPHGRCYTFDDRADGIALGEGAGVVVLKRLADAERDGDCIYGVVEGWGVNQDGKTNGITAPNANAQARLQQQVYERFGIDPAAIGLVETHGTGTALGDPIEVAALKTSFTHYTQRTHFCALGSVKSNIGHCLAAAGVSGFIKALLAIGHGQLPPSAQLRSLNRHIVLQGSPFFINDTLQAWPRDGAAPRRAAINAFGFGGTNAHAVVAEYTGRSRAAAGPMQRRATLDEQGRAVLVPLSARTHEQLAQQARALLAFLGEHLHTSAAPDLLARTAYTLQVGRHAMSERVAFVAASLDDLQTKLLSFVECEHGAASMPDGVYRADVATNRETLQTLGDDADFRQMIDKWIAQRALPKLADLWTKGLVLDWTRFYPDGTPQRIGLPLYPFAGERYWLSGDVAVQHGAARIAHPLLHANTSNLSRQRYRTEFNGDEAFLRDASADGGAGRVSLALCLEMARAAIDDARADDEHGRLNAGHERQPFVLRDIEWRAVDGVGQLTTELAPLHDGQIEFEIHAEQADRAVLCRGTAEPAPVPGRRVVHDLEQRRRELAPGNGEALLLLDWADSEDGISDAFVLPPHCVDSAIRSALQCVGGFDGDALREVTCEALSVFARGGHRAFAWVRAAASGVGIDIDICDADGTVCVAMVGLVHGGTDQNAALASRIPASATAEATEAVATSARAAEPSTSLATLRMQLRASLAQALLIEPGDIDIGRSFVELGLDSILAVEWVNALNRQYELALNATRIYDHPNLERLATFIAAQRSAEPEPHGSASDAAPMQRQVPPQPAPARRATGRFASRATAGAAFSFAPRHVSPNCDLYFYSPHCEGDFESDGQCTVRFVIGPQRNVCLREHVVAGHHLLPTDAFVELVNSAFRTYFEAGAVSIERIALASPLFGTPGRDCHVTVEFRRSGDMLQFFVRSSIAPDGAGERLHMQGFIAAAPDQLSQPALLPAFDVEHTLARADIPTNTGTCYAPLESLAFGASYATAEIRPASHSFGFTIGPFALYGGLCTVINYATWLVERQYGACDDAFLPHRIGALAARHVLDGRAYRVHARMRALERDVAEFDFDIVDETGALALSVERISLRRVSAQALSAQATLARWPQRERESGKAAEKVAVIGMACRYPQSPDVEAFWRNLAQGVDCVVEVPADRWPDDDWFHADPRHRGTSYSKWAGLLERIDTFDPLFFGISPAEAELMDPQQRIFLEECWKAIEHAGYAPSALSTSTCGVYVGCSTGDYGRVLQRAGEDTAGPAFMGTSNAILAARISYLLNLKGPAVAIDTACSSSLVAVHLACESIRSGENDVALAGGVNVLATPIGHILTSQVGMPSPDGRCAAFDASANGIVFAEGCGVLVLKALSKALADNDEILGVIDASGTNQDGRTNGITAPSTTAQEQLLRQVYRRFGIDPGCIGYVEAHGTGTPLGDPIEVAALGSAFGAAAQPCALGSVKSNIGHTGFAAGVAGLIKVLLCLRHRKLAPSLHYRKPNPHIDFASSPFFVNTAYGDWASDTTRVAAVSAFGFSGTNAHVVVSEYVHADDAPVLPALAPVPASASRAAAPCRYAVPLSARSESQLREQAARLLAYLSAAAQPVDLRRIAYTLQVGRDAMAHRVGFIAASAAQLEDQLRAYLDGRSREFEVYCGPPTPDAHTQGLFADDGLRRLLDEWLAQRNLPKVLNLWVRGVDLDWRALYGRTRPRPLALPTYPFAPERYWAGSAGNAPRSSPARADAADSALHPLLHRNTSNLDGQRYTSRFTGRERLLAEHRVNGQPVLPAAAYLEMVRAALADALPGGLEGRCAQLRDVVWTRPFVAIGEGCITVSLYEAGGDDGWIDFEFASVAPDSGMTLHCRGRCRVHSLPSAQPLDLARLGQRMNAGRLDPAELYPRFAALGLEYGPAYRGVVALHQGDGEALVELSVPMAANDELCACVLHPLVLDSALQGTIGLVTAVDGRPALPFALEALDVMSPCTAQMRAWVRYTNERADEHVDRGAARRRVDIDLCDRDGVLCARLRGFASRPMDGTTAQEDADLELQQILERVLNHDLSSSEAAELTRLKL